ncbi:MAG: STAS domain-containing protein [bacterium]
MTAMALQEREERVSDDALDGLTRLRLSGPLTAATAPQLRALLGKAAAESAPRLLLDLQAVTAVDAVGVAALLNVRRLVAAQERGVMVLRPNRIVERALRDSGTLTAFEVWNGSGM